MEFFEIVVKRNNWRSFGITVAGSVSHRSNRVRTTRLLTWSPRGLALVVVVRGRRIHRTPLLFSTAP